MAQWGRKETVVWPPHRPVYSYGATFVAVLLAAASLWLHFETAPPLARYYTPAYIRFGLVSVMNRPHLYRLLYVCDAEGHARLATAVDVAAGETETPGEKPISLALSERGKAKGLALVYRGAEQTYRDTQLQPGHGRAAAHIATGGLARGDARGVESRAAPGHRAGAALDRSGAGARRASRHVRPASIDRLGACPSVTSSPLNTSCWNSDRSMAKDPLLSEFDGQAVGKTACPCQQAGD